MLLLLLALQAPPDEAACMTFVRAFEAAVVSGDGAAADRLLDRKALLDRTFEGTPEGGRSKEGFRKGLLSSFHLGASIASTLREQEGTYRFLRLKTAGKSRRALFRMVLGDSFNYHDFLLEAGPDGTVKASDVHVLLSGEWMSETFRRIYLGMLAAEPGMLGKLTGAQNEYVNALTKVQEMTRLRQAGQAAEALAVYATLPAVAKRDKMALLTRYQAAIVAAPEDLPAVLDDFEKAHPKDPCLPAISIGAHMQARRFDKALAAVDAVDAAVEGDAYMDVQRAAIHLEAGAFDRAKAAAKKAIEREKGLADGYWTLVTISLQEKSYADTARWLNAVETDLGIEIGDLKDVELYAGFVKSPEYAEWMKARTK